MKLRLESPTSLKFGGPILISCTTWTERVTVGHNSVAYIAAVVHSLVKSGTSKKSTWSQQNQNKSEKLDAARYICNIYIYISYIYIIEHITDSKTTILSITYYGTDPWNQASPGSLSLEGLFPSDHIVNLAFCVIRHFFETLTSLTN